MTKTVFSLAFLTLACAGSALQALTVPYTEDFTVDNANWRTNVTATFMTYVPAGGPDGSSYASAPFNFLGSTEGTTPVLNRANSGASGNNFFGNWIAGGVKEFRAYVRHNATVPLSYFLRVADPVGFPGFVVTEPAAVLPNTWTLVDFTISPTNPNNLPEGQPFGSVFDSIGRVQLGAFVPAALAGVDQSFSFDLDQVTVDVPEPGTLALCLVSLAGVVSCRRNRTATSSRA